MTSSPFGGAPWPWYRVVAIPDASCGGTAERDYALVLPAALEATRQRRPIIIGWICRDGGAPLDLISNAGPATAPPKPRHLEHPYAEPESAGRAPAAPPAPAAVGPAPAAPVELLFPWGARAVRLDESMLAELDRMVWAACPGRLALPLGAWSGSSEPGQPQPGQHRQAGGPAESPGWLAAASLTGATPSQFESVLTTLLPRRFGWLVIAAATDVMASHIAALEAEVNALRRFDEERSRYRADRAARRLAELDAFHQGGLWNVRVLVGAADASQVSVVAPLLVGSAGLAAHPYRLRSPGPAMDLADALTMTAADESDESAVPFLATAGVLTALAGLPRREVPGVRVLDAGYFDVTADPPGPDEIPLGAILDGQDRAVGEFGVPRSTLNRHALVAGATGSGKSQTVRHLLAQLTGAGVPWLVVEPVKSEYAAIAGRIPGQLTLISPTDPAAVPLAINPLAPEPGYPVQAHIDLVRALFLAAFDAHEPFPQIMSQALQKVYESCGWDPVTGAAPPGAIVPPEVPTLAQLRSAALEVIADVGYGRELHADVRGFVDVRLRSLQAGSAGRFFEGGHPVDIGELLRRNVVLAIEDVTNDEDKAFLIGTLIIRLTEHLRLRARAEAAGQDGGQGGQAGVGRLAGLRHVMVIEEAHRLLRADRDGAAAHAVELFAGLLAEIRAYGEGLVIAEQIPAKLVADVVKNTALKVVHRLPAHDDRQVVGATMNLDAEQSRQVVSFPPGVAAVFTDGMDRPLRIRVPFGGDTERQPAPGQLAAPPLAGRRSSACGPACTDGRACSLVQLRSADLLADAPEQAWLRVWTEAVVLAFLTNSPLPVVPGALRQRWAALDERLRECALATIAERIIAMRSAAIRPCFDPAGLTAAVAATALRILGGGKGAGTQPGPGWVIPQLQWLRELERALPLNGPSPDPFELALPLEFELAGVADQPDIKVGQRISALRRHPLSMELDANRLPAMNALLGEDNQVGFCADLAKLAVGSSHRGQLLQAAGEMGVAGWLEPVLSWPRRFIVGGDDEFAALRRAEDKPGDEAAG